MGVYGYKASGGRGAHPVTRRFGGTELRKVRVRSLVQVEVHDPLALGGAEGGDERHESGDFFAAAGGGGEERGRGGGGGVLVRGLWFDA